MSAMVILASIVICGLLLMVKSQQKLITTLLDRFLQAQGLTPTTNPDVETEEVIVPPTHRISFPVPLPMPHDPQTILREVRNNINGLSGRAEVPPLGDK